MDNQMPTQLIRRETSDEGVKSTDYEVKYKKLHKKYKKLKKLCAELYDEVEFLTGQVEDLTDELNQYVDEYTSDTTSHHFDDYLGFNETEEDDEENFLSYEAGMIKAEYNRGDCIQIASPDKKHSLSRVRLTADPICGKYRIGFKF